MQEEKEITFTEVVDWWCSP